MKKLLNNLSDNTKSIPCLFYPVAKELGLSINQILTDEKEQAKLLLYIANNYSVGAVVRMTELWCEAASFGMEVTISETDFPILGKPIYSDTDEMEHITLPPVINSVTYPLIKAVELVAPDMNIPLIVGVTGPYTLGSVLNGSEDFMVNCMMEEEIMSGFLDTLTDFLIDYILEYKKAGANAVMIAEPSVAMISPDMLEQYSNCYINRIISSVSDESFSVIYHNCGDVNRHLETISKLNADGFHFGSQVGMGKAMNLFTDNKLIMGNIEPQLFIEEDISKINDVKSQLTNLCGDKANFKLSTGCDLSPKSDLNVIRSVFC